MRKAFSLTAVGVVSVVAAVASADAAAALDCTKAKSDAEKAICGDPSLKAQDAALSRFYFDTLRTLKGSRHDLLISDQRRWLAEDRDACLLPSGKPAPIVPCLAGNLAVRRRAIAICFAGARDGSAELAGKPITGADLCQIFSRSGCPTMSATASARLVDYPWLFDALVERARKGGDGADCGPEGADDPGTADQNESTTTETILAERPGLVSISEEEDDMFRGAAHPEHGEEITSYDTRTKAEIKVNALLPTLKKGSPLLATLSQAANKVLSPSCCEGDEDHTFSGIGLDSNEPMPTGWSVAPNGDLILAYDYDMLGRSFVATAVIPRHLFIDAIDPKYAGLFTPAN